MIEFRTYWTKWRFDIDRVYYDEAWIGLWAFYFGPFVLVWHKAPK